MSLLLLTGCKNLEGSVDRALGFREQLLNSNGCSFDALVTADYTDVQYTFNIHCEADAQGAISFQVLSPETIAGIAGTISEDGGRFTFDGETLLFPLLIEGVVSPVSAPWLFLEGLQSGYISGCAQTDQEIEIHIDDTYEGHNLKFIVKADSSACPVFADIFWNGQRILSLNIENFKIL